VVFDDDHACTLVVIITEWWCDMIRYFDILLLYITLLKHCSIQCIVFWLHQYSMIAIVDFIMTIPVWYSWRVLCDDLLLVYSGNIILLPPILIYRHYDYLTLLLILFYSIRPFVIIILDTVLMYLILLLLLLSYYSHSYDLLCNAILLYLFLMIVVMICITTM